MSYANLILEKTSDNESRIVTPIGFSGVTLFLPIIVGVLFPSIWLALVAMFGIVDVDSLGESNMLIKFLIILVFIVLFSFQLISFSLVPLIRKDIKWAIIMALSGILTLGLSVVIFAFIYNRYFIYERYKEGYRISKIMTINNKSKPLPDLNPIEFSEKYDQFFIWENWHHVKFMRYFNNVNSALSFVSSNPEKCMKIRHIVKGVNSLSQFDDRLKEKYRLPINAWQEQTTSFNFIAKII